MPSGNLQQQKINKFQLKFTSNPRNKKSEKFFPKIGINIPTGIVHHASTFYPNVRQFIFKNPLGSGRRRTRSTEHGVAVGDERSHHLLAGRTNYLSTMVNTSRYTNAARQEIFSRHVHRLNCLDCGIFISYGLVG
jgi:hypothetical protein